ncbi:MAG: hypothetical protein ACP5MG_05780 [Verrucomicrobiia bacterium]
MSNFTKHKEFREIGEKIVDFMRYSLSQNANTHVINNLWNNIAIELFNLQYQYILPYKNFCDFRLKDITDVNDWTHIPCLPTTAFKEFDITSLDKEERTAVFYSSGTTSDRSSRHFHNNYSLQIYEESLSLWFRNCLLNNRDERMQLIILTPSSESAPNSSLVHMFSTLKARFGTENSAFFGFVEGENVWKIDYELLFAALRDCEKSASPVIVLGTAFNYVHLVDYIELKRTRFALPDGSVVFETGGYKGRSREIPKNELYKMVSFYLGIDESNIVSEYGMSEISSQAYDRILNREAKDHSRAFKFPPWAKYSIVSPETKEPVNIGEFGILRIYDLANVFSVMAIQTDDIALKLNEGFTIVGRAGQSEPRGCSIMAGF